MLMLELKSLQPLLFKAAIDLEKIGLIQIDFHILKIYYAESINDEDSIDETFTNREELENRYKEVMEYIKENK